MKLLSTSFTFFIKISVPFVILVCIICMLFFLLFAIEFWIFALLSAAIGFVVFWLYGDVKEVERDGSNLYVSNYFSREVIPLVALKEVYEDRILSTSFIRLRFKYKTKFGQEIKFVPHSMRNYFYPHPTADELRKLIK